MKRCALSIFFVLLVVVMIHPAFSADTTKVKKSMVLKDPLPTAIYIQEDRSDEDLWNEFMLVKKANAGDPVSQHNLGLCYLTGTNFFPDTSKALYWIDKAAKQNLLPAKYNLGILLNNGWGAPWNPFEAYKDFQYAAEHGMPEAEYVYGLLHTDNLVVERNYSEAYRWLRMAADSGYTPANAVITEFNKLGLLTSLNTDQQEDSTKGGKQRAAVPDTSGKPSFRPVFINFASDSLSTPGDASLLHDALLEHSRKGEKNDTEPDTSFSDDDSTHLDVIRSEAESGSPEALTVVGRWFEKGTVLPQDNVMASVNYLRAVRCDARYAPMLLWKLTRTDNYYTNLKSRIDQNDPAAKFVWAELVASGFDEQLTTEQALKFLEEASKQGYTEATVQLGICYFTGKWVKPDHEKGKKLLQKAADTGNREAQIRLWMTDLQSKEQVAGPSLVDSLRRASDAGSVLAQAMLGYCYQKGIGVPLSIPQSVYFYRKAAERGSETAYNALKDIYASMRPKDPEFQVNE